MRSIVSVAPVSFPGANTDDPEKTLTATSWPLRTAMPISSSFCAGWPMRTLAGFDLGTKRTRPLNVSKYARFSLGSCATYARRQILKTC